VVDLRQMLYKMKCLAGQEQGRIGIVFGDV
jgi:hypothetical protein